MRLRARRDANHAEIVAALRAAGRLVLDLAAVGHGCPDLLAAWGGGMVLLEIKDGSKPPSARKLTADETAFHTLWGRHVVVVSSVAEALAATGVSVATSAA